MQLKILINFKMFINKINFKILKCNKIQNRFLFTTNKLNLKFVQFLVKSDENIHLGIIDNNSKKVTELRNSNSSKPFSMMEFLKNNEIKTNELSRVNQQKCYNLNEIKLVAPLQGSDKIVGVAANYKSFLKALNRPTPKEPIFFSKFVSTIIGPLDYITLPNNSKEVDWEVELAVVIGKTTKNINENESQNHIFGYTLAQDLTARDWVRDHNGGQFLLGKNMDTFTPLGPTIVTKEELNDIKNVEIKCWLNNELKQCINTSDMIFQIDFIIAYLSRVMTLYPGDIILTGTGPGTGNTQNPNEFLKKGDIIESEIIEIGRMKNKVI